MKRWMLIAAVIAAAGGPVATAGAQDTYAQQRADCLAGRGGQDRATCLREAAAARAEQRRGTLAAGDEATWERNALRRCERHPAGDEREACERMARGEGTQQGSVAEGGVIKELVIRSVEPAASAP